MSRPRVLGLPPLAGALLAVVFWGVSFVATKLVVAQISPITLITVRALIGSVVIVILVRAQGQTVVPPRDEWLALARMGFVGVAFHQLLQAFALRLTTAVSTGWLIGLTPLWSAVLAAAALRERFPPAKVAGLALGFVGALLVVTRGEMSAATLALPATRGDLLILVSTVNWAFYTVIGHDVIRRLGPTRATAGALVFGTILLLPVGLATRMWLDLPHLTPAGWGAVVFLGACCSALGYLFWYGALETIEASKVAALLYLEPLVTLLAAMAILGERVTLVTVAGGLLVLAGVVVVQRSR